MLLAVCALPDSASAQGESHQLKLDLDSLLSLPNIWETKPQVLEDKFAEDGFKSSPYFAWAGEDKQARVRAVFGKRPYRNVSVDATLFGGKVPVQQALADFKDGKLNQLRIIVSDPSDGGKEGPGVLSGRKDVCETAINKMLAAQPVSQAPAFGSKALASGQRLVWKGGTAVAVLDYNKDGGLLEFVLAPPSVEIASLGSRAPVASSQGSLSLFVNLDSVLAVPALWELTPDKLAKMFDASGPDTPYFQWLTTDKSGVRFTRKPFGNVDVDLTAFNGTVRVEEATIEFTGGKASKVNLSLYNRGDSGDVSREMFDLRYKTAGVSLSKLLGTRPIERKPNAQTAVKISGWYWNAPTALASLEYNTEALTTGTPEFLRMKMAAPGARDAFASESGQSIRKTSLGKSVLPKFVKREAGGDVFIGSVPMVDQGAKGYCVVASCQRLFGYFQIPVDQHELAQMAASDAERGTNSGAMEDTLKKIDSRFKVNFKPLAYRLNRGGMGVPVGNRISEVNPGKFVRFVEDYTSKGIPLLWALELGIVPEEPPIALQAGGGHMRLIIGINASKDELLFTDSWGAGHELKRMKMSDAFKATLAVYVVEPKDY